MNEPSETYTSPNQPEILFSYNPDEPLRYGPGVEFWEIDQYCNHEAAFLEFKIDSSKIWTVREMTTNIGKDRMALYKVVWLGFDSYKEVEAYIDEHGSVVKDEEKQTKTSRAGFFNTLNTKQFSGYEEGDLDMPSRDWPYWTFNLPK